MRKIVLGLVCLALVASTAQGAFIVEPHSSGLAFGNFIYSDGTAVSASIPGGAVGLTATNSAYGGNGTIDQYDFIYTPGGDADNAPMVAGTALGDAELQTTVSPAYNVVNAPLLASGLVGGETGLYNVYITWPASTNVNAAGSVITVTHDGGATVYDPVGQNNDGASVTDAGIGGAGQWLKIADSVQLTQGGTYSVTQLANVASFVSQRNAGVMWERVPEPATLALMLPGLLLLRRRRA